MTDQVAMITGAANGIGRATALEFARRGARVVVTDIDLDAARDVAQQIGGAACAFHLDVTSEDSIAAAFDEATAAVGPITVVHANAGVSSMKPATELTQADWDFNMNINAKGVYLTNVAAVRQFRKNNVKGVIVNTASLAAKVGAPLLAHYSASKFAVVGWTQALAREVAAEGIRVNAVCPGFVKTPMQQREVAWEAELRGMTPEEVLQSYVAQTPLGRLETPEDVAGVVIFLASDDARFMTGQAINVTGGVYMT